jgi:hypothetical protein
LGLRHDRTRGPRRIQSRQRNRDRRHLFRLPAAFVLRNLYWRQGSSETGWVYRLGKITPDALLGSSPHLDSQTTFLPSGGTGPFAIALPDSGLGAVGAWYFNDRVGLAGDRFDSGDIGEGDFLKAAELQVKIAPSTPEAGYSKLTPSGPCRHSPGCR